MKAVCLTIAVTLGAYLADVVVVGGLVPSLLIDAQRAERRATDQLHPGTNDLDLGLALALLDEKRYAAVSERLRAEGFGPDENANGNPTVQRWQWNGLKVDFLIQLPPDAEHGLRVHNLEPDFGALITPGLELAFDEKTSVEIEGMTLKGEKATRALNVCGPGAFVALKALAFGDRAEPKDAYDLTYVIRETQGAGNTIGAKLAEHAVKHPAVVEKAMKLLRRDFSSPDAVGPMRAAEFEHASPEDRTNATADAHGFVDDVIQHYSAMVAERRSP